MGFTEINHVLKELENISILLQKSPVQPGGNVILTVGIVVAKLCIAEFVSGQEHGDTAAAHQDCKGVAYHPFSESQNFGVVCVPFNSAVPTMIVVGPVGIIPAVLLIVLHIV